MWDNNTVPAPNKSEMNFDLAQKMAEEILNTMPPQEQNDFFKYMHTYIKDRRLEELKIAKNKVEYLERTLEAL